MDFKRADELCRTFRRRAPGRELRCKLIEEGYVMEPGPHGYRRSPDYRMVFEGGKTGVHSIAISASTPARAEAHWRGYAENNGLLAPEVGEVVRFPSGSAKDGSRYGKVVRVGTRRVLVSYKFKSGHAAAPKWVPLHQIVFSKR